MGLHVWLLNAFWKKIIISFVGSSAVSFQTANTIVKKQFPLLPKMPHIRVCLCQSYPLPYYSFCFVNYSIFAGSLILILVGGFNHPEKYEFVNGKDDIPYMKWKIVLKKVRNHQPVMVLNNKCGISTNHPFLDHPFCWFTYILLLINKISRTRSNTSSCLSASASCSSACSFASMGRHFFVAILLSTKNPQKWTYQWNKKWLLVLKFRAIINFHRIWLW